MRYFGSYCELYGGNKWRVSLNCKTKLAYVCNIIYFALSFTAIIQCWTMPENEKKNKHIESKLPLHIRALFIWWICTTVITNEKFRIILGLYHKPHPHRMRARSHLTNHFCLTVFTHIYCFFVWLLMQCPAKGLTQVSLCILWRIMPFYTALINIISSLHWAFITGVRG